MTDDPQPGTPDSEDIAVGESQPDDSDGDDVLAALAQREGWRTEGNAARVHYSGAGDRYSIEFYEPSRCTLYWKVPPADSDETAVPVGRSTVPTPLRERIQADLAAAGIDPEVDQRTL